MELWRLTRNPYGRAVWEAFERAGLKAAKMDEWVREGSPVETETPPGVSLDVRTVTDAPEGDAFDELAADDRVILASDGDERIGRTFVSDRPVYVPVLEREFRYDGCYLWRVFVDPDHRERGVASALLTRAVTVAAETFDRQRCVALVAVDNRPSQWLFEGTGFEPRRRHTYYHVFGLERRRATAVS
jgi:GNAT superfamily N-acetyltransferase